LPPRAPARTPRDLAGHSRAPALLARRRRVHVPIRSPVRLVEAAKVDNAVGGRCRAMMLFAATTAIAAMVASGHLCCGLWLRPRLVVLRRLWEEGFSRRKSCSAFGRAGSDDVQWTSCSPLGALSRCPPLPDRSLSVKTLPEFAQAGGGAALGVVPSLEASSLENMFRYSPGGQFRCPRGRSSRCCGSGSSHAGVFTSAAAVARGDRRRRPPPWRCRCLRTISTYDIDG